MSISMVNLKSLTIIHLRRDTPLVIISRSRKMLFEHVQEAAIIVLRNVIHIPQPTAPDVLAGSPPTKPSGARRIDGPVLMTIVAEQGNGIALDVAAQTRRSGLIGDTQPQKRHAPNVPADGPLQGILPIAHMALEPTAQRDVTSSGQSSRCISAVPTCSRNTDAR